MSSRHMYLIAGSLLLILGIAMLVSLGIQATSQGSPAGKAENNIPGNPITPSIVSQQSHNDIVIKWSKEIVIPKELLMNLFGKKCNASAPKITPSLESFEGSIITAYDHTLVLGTDEGTIKIMMPNKLRNGAAEYDLLSLFAEGILSKGKNVKVDAIVLYSIDGKNIEVTFNAEKINAYDIKKFLEKLI